MKEQGLIKRFLYKLMGAPSQQIVEKSSRVQDMDLWDFQFTRGIDAPVMDDLLASFTATDWIYRAVSVTAQSVASIDMLLYSEQPDGSNEIVQAPHDMLTLLWHPNPQMNYTELIETTQAHLELTGNAYWELVGNNPDEPISESNPPIEIYTLQPDRIRVIPDRKIGVGGYIYSVNGKEFRLDPSFVIHFRYRNPADEHYGVSPLTAARMAATGDLFASSYNMAFFENSAEPAGVLQCDKQLSIEQVARMQKIWAQTHQGAKRAHRVAILGEGVKWQSTSLAPKDMQFVEQQKFSGERILRAFGVPPLLAGVLEYSNYSLAIEQRRLYWENTLMPKMKTILAGVNRGLAPHFGESLYVEFDLSKITALQDSEDAKVTRATQLVQSDVMTVNEVRERFWQMEPVPWGNAPSAYLSPGVLMRSPDTDVASVDEVAGDAGVPTEGADASPSGKSFFVQPLTVVRKNGERYSGYENQILWTAYLKRYNKTERSFKAALNKYFKEQRERIIAKLEAEPHLLSIDKALNANSLIDDAEVKRLIDLLTDEIGKGIASGLQGVVDDYGQPRENWSPRTHMRNEQIAEYIRQLAAKKVTNITNTTRAQLNKIFQQQPGQRFGMAKLAEEIRKSTAFSPWRSENIARTETGNALNYGTMRGYHLSGFEKKGWLGQCDGWIREGHRIAHDNYANIGIPLTVKFNVPVYKGKQRAGSEPMMHPGDWTASAGNVCNCRCTMVPFGQDKALDERKVSNYQKMLSQRSRISSNGIGSIGATQPSYLPDANGAFPDGPDAKHLLDYLRSTGLGKLVSTVEMQKDFVQITLPSGRRGTAYGWWNKRSLTMRLCGVDFKNRSKNEAEYTMIHELGHAMQGAYREWCSNMIMQSMPPPHDPKNPDYPFHSWTDTASSDQMDTTFQLTRDREWREALRRQYPAYKAYDDFMNAWNGERGALTAYAKNSAPHTHSQEPLAEMRARYYELKEDRSKFLQECKDHGCEKTGIAALEMWDLMKRDTQWWRR